VPSRTSAAFPRTSAALSLSKGAPHAKAGLAGPLLAFESLRSPVWSPRDYVAFAREGFMQNAIVYRSVRMVAEAAASVPLLLYEGDQEIGEHPLLDLIARPNPVSSAPDLLESWYGFLLVSGNAYLEAVAIGGTLRELHVLRPDRMKVIPGPNGWPEAFEYTADGNTVRFTGEVTPGVRPVLHVKLFHPVNDHYGLSPIEAAASAIDTHNTASRWNKALLDNSARPSGALVYTSRDGNLSPEQYERLKSELEQGFQGAARAGRPLLLEGGLDWKSMSLTPKDMDFIDAEHRFAMTRPSSACPRAGACEEIPPPRGEL
jgi:HK97 family phage portal protein